MKNRKRFLQLVLAVALLPTLSSVAQSESVVALSGNAYVTVASEGKAFIDEGNCAIRNWNDARTVVSYYFRTEKSGKMNIALQAKGHSQIEVWREL